MKNLIYYTLITILSTTIVSNAQSFGIKTGYTSSNMLYKIDGHTKSNDYLSLNGFNAGAIIDFKINNTLVFNTGINYTTKGFKEETIQSNNTTGFGGIIIPYSYEEKFKVKLSYVGIPINLKIYQNITDQSKIYGLIGGYLDFAVHGNRKTSKHLTPNSIVPPASELEDQESTIPFGFKSDTFNVLDFGGTLGIGFEYNSFILEGNYNIGASNLFHYTSEKSTAYNRYLNISVGYIFNKAKKEKS